MRTLLWSVAAFGAAAALTVARVQRRRRRQLRHQSEEARRDRAWQTMVARASDPTGKVASRSMNDAGEVTNGEVI